MSRLARYVGGDLQILTAGHVLESGMRFGAFVAYSRMLGDAGVGRVATVAALIYLLTELTTFGVDASVISLGSKELGQGEHERLAELCRTGLWLHLALGTALALLGCLSAPYLVGDPSVALALTVAFAGSVLHRVAEYGRSVLRTYQRFRLHAVAGLAGAGTLLAGVIALGWSGRIGVLGVLVLIFVAAPASVLAVAIFGLPSGVCRPRLPAGDRVGELLTFGKWVWATSVLEQTVTRSNVLLLRAFAGEAATGQFQTATRYVEFLSLVFEPLRKYLLPKFTELSDRQAIASLLRRTYRPLAWTLLLIPIAWVAAPLITEVQGEGWRTAVQVFRVAVVARLLFLLAKPMTFVLFSLKRPAIQTMVHLVGAVAFFASVWVLIPRYGATGSAVALLVFSGTVLIALVTSLRREWAR